MRRKVIGAAVRDLREQRGIKQSELAEAAGITAPYLSQIENEKRERPALEVLQLLARGLGVTVDDISERVAS